MFLRAFGNDASAEAGGSAVLCPTDEIQVAGAVEPLRALAKMERDGSKMTVRS